MRGYDQIIVDLGTGIHEVQTRLMPYFSKIIVLSTTEPASIANTYALLKIWCEQGQNDKVEVVFNNTPSIILARQAHRNLNKILTHFLNTSVRWGGWVQAQKELGRQLEKGEPIYKSLIFKKLCQNLELLAEYDEQSV